VDIRLVLACDHFTQVDGETSGTFRVRFADSWFFAARSLVGPGMTGGGYGFVKS
jgi:hypothetical protein